MTPGAGASAPRGARSWIAYPSHSASPFLFFMEMVLATVMSKMIFARRSHRCEHSFAVRHAVASRHLRSYGHIASQWPFCLPTVYPT